MICSVCKEDIKHQYKKCSCKRTMQTPTGYHLTLTDYIVVVDNVLNETRVYIDRIISNETKVVLNSVLLPLDITSEYVRKILVLA